MNRRSLALCGAILTAGIVLGGCSHNPNPNQPPVPTTAATDANGNNAKLVIPSDLVGKNAQLADDELRKVGFVNIKYGTQDTTLAAPDPAHLADWNVTAVEPAGGQTAQSNDNIVVTVVKK
jgi:hypothetical protein